MLADVVRRVVLGWLCGFGLACAGSEPLELSVDLKTGTGQMDGRVRTVISPKGSQ